MAVEDTAALTAEQQLDAEDAQAQADFDAGAAPDPAPKGDAPTDVAAAPEPKAPAATPEPKPPAAPRPKYVRLTEEQFKVLNEAAAKTASFEGQFSKIFGTVGKLQQTITGLQAGTPRGGKVEIPKDAFAAMERDFPELAEQIRGALEKTLAGVTGTGPANAEIDPEVLKRVADHAEARVEKARFDAEVKKIGELEPDWKAIVGHVSTDKGEKPDPNNAFRKWLAAKGAAYEARVTGTLNASVLSREIDKFQAETKAPPAPTPSPRQQQQAARIAGAVRPRGDGGQPAPANTDEDEFNAGFNAA